MVPAFGVEPRMKVPPIWSAKARTRNRPRPRPAPGGLVLKNGSPARAACGVVHAAAVVDHLDPEPVRGLDPHRHPLIGDRRVESVAYQRNQGLAERFSGHVD